MTTTTVTACIYEVQYTSSAALGLQAVGWMGWGLSPRNMATSRDFMVGHVENLRISGEKKQIWQLDNFEVDLGMKSQSHRMDGPG